jgi:hypothetical protein
MAYPNEAASAILTKCNSLTGKTDTSHVTAANHAAGTVGWDLVGALNVIAGNPKTNYKEHDGVLNQLAGTSGWGANAAASRWAGLY